MASVILNVVFFKISIVDISAILAPKIEKT